MDFLHFADERYSCRKFSDREVEQEKIDKILEAAIAAPTAVNLQPYKIWVVREPKNIDKIKLSTQFTFGAKLILIVGANEQEGWVRGFDKKHFAQIDASIVATHIILAAQSLGLGSTWVGYFENVKLKSMFPKINDYEIVGLFPIGYPADDAKPATRHTDRKPVEELVEYC